MSGCFPTKCQCKCHVSQDECCKYCSEKDLSAIVLKVRELEDRINILENIIPDIQLDNEAVEVKIKELIKETNPKPFQFPSCIHGVVGYCDKCNCNKPQICPHCYGDYEKMVTSIYVGIGKQMCNVCDKGIVWCPQS